MPYRQALIQKHSINGSPLHVPMLAIAGDSATGKTTLSKGLAKALGPEQITWMCTDDYHRYDRNERKDLPFTALHPDCNYLEIMEQHLQLLTLGQPILKPIYNHDGGTLDRPVLVQPTKYVIVDGLFPLWSKLSRACFDVTVFLDPPEHIRRQWKVYRDVTKRHYTEAQVLKDLDKREPESEAYIRPQRKNADIVIRFAPVEGAADSKTLSATILLRPTIPHPDLSDVLSNNPNGALHMKLIRDDDGKPVDAIHVHGHATREASREIEAAIWSKLGIDTPVPECLGEIEDGRRSEPLAIAQLILLYHLLLVS